MPSRSVTTGQDYKPQVFNFGPRPTSSSAPKKLSEAEAARAMQKGAAVLIAKKEHIPGNHHTNLGKTAKRLDDDTENYKHKTIDPALRANIQRYRQAKGLTQTDLARLINERATIINEYEGGKAIPSEAIIVKMEKVLNVHLRGAKAGEEFAKKPAPKA